MKEKIYYLPTTDWTTFYGSGDIVCIDEAERNRLAREWGMDPDEDFREADADEIEQYGVYES